MPSPPKPDDLKRLRKTLVINRMLSKSFAEAVKGTQDQQTLDLLNKFNIEDSGLDSFIRTIERARKQLGAPGSQATGTMQKLVQGLNGRWTLSRVKPDLTGNVAEALRIANIMARERIDILKTMGINKINTQGFDKPDIL